MVFALRSVTTLPMRVMTTDDAMFEDLAGLHAERLGMRPDPLAGQLNDLFEVERDGESAVLVSAWLKSPVDGDLPKVGPKAFDISARLTAAEGDGVTIWRELGRWVFAVYQSGKLLYAQATASEAEHPDESVARELKLALMQLSMQGLDPRPQRVLVWASGSSLTDTDLSALRDAFDLPVETHERPHPVLPDPISKLLPEDVRAARSAAQRRQRIQMTIGAVAALYLVLVGWLANGLWQDNRKVADLEEQIRQASPYADAFELHMERWHDLSQVIDIDHYPVEILSRIASCIPRNAQVRLTSADISADTIRLKGEAPNIQAANQFSLKIKNNTSLWRRYDWELRDSKPGPRGRTFEYTATLKAEEVAP